MKSDLWKQTTNQTRMEPIAEQATSEYTAKFAGDASPTEQISAQERKGRQLDAPKEGGIASAKLDTMSWSRVAVNIDWIRRVDHDRDLIR